MQQVELAAAQHLLKTLSSVKIVYNYGLWEREPHFSSWRESQTVAISGFPFEITNVNASSDIFCKVRRTKRKTISIPIELYLSLLIYSENDK